MFKHLSVENKGSDHRGYCLDIKQILLASSITNVWRTVRRICIFISGLIKRVKSYLHQWLHDLTFCNIPRTTGANSSFLCFPLEKNRVSEDERTFFFFPESGTSKLLRTSKSNTSSSGGEATWLTSDWDSEEIDTTGTEVLAASR